MKYLAPAFSAVMLLTACGKTDAPESGPKSPDGRYASFEDAFMNIDPQNPAVLIGNRTFGDDNYCDGFHIESMAGEIPVTYQDSFTRDLENVVCYSSTTAGAVTFLPKDSEQKASNTEIEPFKFIIVDTKFVKSNRSYAERRYEGGAMPSENALTQRSIEHEQSEFLFNSSSLRSLYRQYLHAAGRAERKHVVKLENPEGGTEIYEMPGETKQLKEVLVDTTANCMAHYHLDTDDAHKLNDFVPFAWSLQDQENSEDDIEEPMQLVLSDPDFREQCAGLKADFSDPPTDIHTVRLEAARISYRAVMENAYPDILEHWAKYPIPELYDY